MPHRHSPYHRWLVILLLALLAPIMPGKMNLCLLPDGEIHLEAECSTPCSQAAAQAPAEAGQLNGFSRLHEGQGTCRDFTVGESAARQQGHSQSQSTVTGLNILPRTIGLFPAGQFRIFAKPPAPSPHLKSHQTTVLRI
jgi:hypothetical protein